MQIVQLSLLTTIYVQKDCQPTLAMEMEDEKDVT